MTDWRSGLRELATDPAFRREVSVGRAEAALAQLIGERMHEIGMKRADLAARLDLTDGELARAFDAGGEMPFTLTVAILWELDINLSEAIERIASGRRKT